MFHLQNRSLTRPCVHFAECESHSVCTHRVWKRGKQKTRPVSSSEPMDSEGRHKVSAAKTRMFVGFVS